MIPKSINITKVKIPLKKPFSTAKRTAYTADILRIAITDDQGQIGYGEAPASAMTTGETLASIEEAILSYIWPAVEGQQIDEGIDKDIYKSIHSVMHRNNSAKAAVEMALFDLQGHIKIGDSSLASDITVSVGNLEDMIESAQSAVADGFSVLKIKLGKSPETDAQTLISLWNSLDNPNIKLRVDANQGWTPSQTMDIIRKWENHKGDLASAIDLIEQPVPYWDIDGLAQVYRSSPFPIAADESVFSPYDALRVIQAQAASVINIKLMKCGGLNAAIEICDICRQHGLECMIGCMLEGNISAAWAAYLAANQDVITRVDLDSPLFLESGHYTGGPAFGSNIIFSSCGSMSRPAQSDRNEHLL